ncbi:hypothetical protein BDN70DRAFT_934103 [Pholiota conissans]|uniref:Uncharacterized protein n=1 Tax=Pholiota conissans TaxID=109636 RepID=A0A9P6CSR1_9AGAR|nr:hypothetical protein BDN70DRAFT_934103 [Pholiota conissans]
MEHSLSPDERAEPPSRKATYLDRKKRKRVLSNPEADSDSETPSSPKTVKSVDSPMKSTPSPKKSTIITKTPASRGPKKVDVNLPGPSPIKRIRRDSEESIKSTKTKKGHVRSVSSIASSKQVAQSVADSPSIGKSKKPESTVSHKPKSRAKSVVADEDFDDNASVADSTISVAKTRRNETERIEYYRNQPECGTLEPHAAECLRCLKTVNLGRKQTYAVRPWEVHRSRCDQKPTKAPSADTPGHTGETPFARAPELPRVDVEDSPPTIIEGAHSITAASSSRHTSARRPSEEERKTYLESEKQIKQIEKNRALCAKCDQWIHLSDANAYASGNWMKHKAKCIDAIPSNRVAAAKRKLLLVNDNQVKSFSTRKVVCKNCNIAIALEGEGDYNLISWEEHKSQCTKYLPIPRSDTLNSIAFPSQSPRATPSSSSASTTDTLVMEAEASSLSQGVKRSREEPDEVPVEDTRPASRIRTAGYLPPQVEPPNSLIGWFMLPFNSFVRGFKESLKDKS